jgi:hypothetical protein
MRPYLEDTLFNKIIFTWKTDEERIAQKEITSCLVVRIQ